MFLQKVSMWDNLLSAVSTDAAELSASEEKIAQIAREAEAKARSAANARKSVSASKEPPSVESN